jgi:hypothetical protein
MYVKTHLLSESITRTQFITRLVNLTPDDYNTVRRYTEDKDLGGKGFSAALRMIIHEWDILRRALLHKPTPEQIAEVSSIVIDISDIDPTDTPEIPGPEIPRRVNVGADLCVRPFP